MTKAIARESVEREGRSHLSAYLPIEKKKRLVSAAQLNDVTLTSLIVAVATNAHLILPLLKLKDVEQNDGSQIRKDSAAVVLT
jgi:hypothetical protein